MGEPRRIALQAVVPPCVAVHALSRRVPPSHPRLAIESYWRTHAVRADRLARALARLGEAPAGWCWRGAEADGPAPRRPPAPYREAPHARGPGWCCLCGQPVFRFGWHRDLWADGRPNRRASWHAACVAAWKLWTAPSVHAVLLRRLQRRRCAVTGERLLRSSEVDHRVSLAAVWRDHRDTPWPDILRFWGVPNLQVVTRGAHAIKTAREAALRAAGPPPAASG